MSGWTAISFRFHPELEDRVVAILHEAGTLGMQMREPSAGLQRGSAQASCGMDEVEATAYFSPRADLTVVERALESTGGAVVLSAAKVQDEQWALRQERDRRPLPVGRRFLILPASPGTGAHPPAGATTASDAPRLPIVIPPQRAFGTGEHATTRLCLEALEDLPIGGARVLDLGTGSGILAMACAILGAREVVGLDNDPEAIEVAEENLALNGLEGRIALEVGDLSRARGPFDLIVANIHAGAIDAGTDRFAELQEARGRLLLSGFSPQEAQDLDLRFAQRGYRRQRSTESGEWSAIVMVKGA